MGKKGSIKRGMRNFGIDKKKPHFVSEARNLRHRDRGELAPAMSFTLWVLTEQR